MPPFFQAIFFAKPVQIGQAFAATTHPNKWVSGLGQLLCVLSGADNVLEFANGRLFHSPPSPDGTGGKLRQKALAYKIIENTH
jgi:hypothetical protein